MTFYHIYQNPIVSVYLTASTSSETQGLSVGSGYTAAKFFKNGRESLSDATLNKPVPRLIRMLVSDWVQNNRRPVSIARLSWSSYTKEFPRKLDFSPYLSGSWRRAVETYLNSTYRFKPLKHLRWKLCACLFTPARHTCHTSARENFSLFKVMSLLLNISPQ